MGNAVRKQKISLEEDLLKNPRKYSFEMTAKILCWHSHHDYGKEISVQDAPMKTVSINSFHLRGTEIEKITNDNNKKVVHVERLSLAGLNAPLPTPYSEMVYNQTMQRDYAFAKFLNSFNARILGISYQVSKRRYLCLQANPKQDYMVMRTLAKFFGEEKIDRKYARLAHLFWTKEKSVVGLESIIKYLYPVDVRVDQFIPMRIKNTSYNRLGHMRLGVNFDLGSHFTVVNMGINVHLSGDGHLISKLIFKKEKREELKRIVKKYLGDFVKFSIFATPNDAPPLKMRQLLGHNTWLPGKNLDESKIC